MRLHDLLLGDILGRGLLLDVRQGCIASNTPVRLGWRERARLVRSSLLLFLEKTRCLGLFRSLEFAGESSKLTRDLNAR